MFYVIYAQADADARPRPSDVLLEGVRLQFIGARATKDRAEFMTQRESRRANGIAACYQDESVDGERVLRFAAAYDRGARRYGKPSPMREAAEAQRREYEATGRVTTTGFERLDAEIAEQQRRAQAKITGK